MKTIRFTLLAAVGLSLSVFAVVVPVVVGQEKAPTKTAASDRLAVAPVATKPAPDATATPWSDIKDIAYDQRAEFFAGLKIVQSKVDAQIAELAARRGAMTSKTETKDWDFAMKEMIESRAYLQSTGEALAKANPETWMQEKDKVGQAWERTQAAYARVKSSTTG